ncbi:MAG TPA: amino acid ABC transporter permease [Anaerolineae bacterium]
MEAAQVAAGGPTHAELILQQQVRAQRVFSTQVVISWMALLGLLVFIFSGQRVQIGPIDIQTIQLDAEFISRAAPVISQGALLTLEISLTSIFFASVLALLTALGRLSRIAPIYALATFYVSLIRGTPLLLQIVFLFLGLPRMGINLSGPTIGVVALSLNYGAYMSEIFRAGIQSVGKGQREAALALGMTQSQLMRRIILPQALRVVIPPTGNEFIAMLKDSSLASITGFVHELAWLGQNLGRREFRSLEALIVVALWYWGMTIVFSWLQSQLEKRMSRGER